MSRNPSDFSDLMSSFKSEDQPSFIQNQHRKFTIGELLDKRSSKFKEFEKLIDPMRIQLEEDFKKASSRINDLKVNDKIWVRFDENDEIFQLCEPIDSRFIDTVSEECNACLKPSSKLKNCDFCGSLNCPNCIFKTRPFPINNPQRNKRGQICIVCNKKFLYRDAMHEFAIKLDMKEGVTQTQQEELFQEEEKYDKLMKDLSDLQELKQTKKTEYKLAQQDCIYEEERINIEIDKIRKEKDYYFSKAQQYQDDYEGKKQKLEKLHEDIKKYEKVLVEKVKKQDEIENEVFSKNRRELSPQTSLRSKSRNGDDRSNFGDQSIRMNINGSLMGDQKSENAINEDNKSNNEGNNNNNQNNMIWEFEEVPASKTRETSPVGRQSQKFWNMLTKKKKKNTQRQLSTQYQMQTDVNYDLITRTDSMKRMTIQALETDKVDANESPDKKKEKQLNRIQRKMQNRRSRKMDQQVNSCQSCEQTCIIF
ncbi:UNKNOWN [Stylonychia lemnae]|uniref:Uncharacterized protein n=1 Tax=Stylonychia lemnae TaxID=5949 RepID=A0A077ZRA9_STYLE|nr:UNKNOWN [Stylonychia lemnae]|eukprot:CDW71875.1 UNKNOWN [Stylonychia lemnae]